MWLLDIYSLLTRLYFSAVYSHSLIHLEESVYIEVQIQINDFLLQFTILNWFDIVLILVSLVLDVLAICIFEKYNKVVFHYFPGQVQ